MMLLAIIIIICIIGAAFVSIGLDTGKAHLYFIGVIIILLLTFLMIQQEEDKAPALYKNYTLKMEEDVYLLYDGDVLIDSFYANQDRFLDSIIEKHEKQH